jgi:hypothetical protein
MSESGGCGAWVHSTDHRGMYFGVPFHRVLISLERSLSCVSLLLLCLSY